MPVSSDEILLVTPVWNDSSRLAGFGAELAKALAGSPLPIRWVIADDGSGPAQQGPLEDLTARFAAVFPRVSLHFAARHYGKGSVVREAWALSPDAEWLAFVDADGSVDPAELLRLIQTAVDANTSALGIRKRTATTRIEESPWRGLFHRGFLVAAHWILGLRSEDPQCGAKVLHGPAYRRIAGGLRENGLAFDSELLYALHRDGTAWLEVPVTWIEKKGGKVIPLLDSWKMLAALLRIRNRQPGG
jgi:glycosyltransferase involved in cell wall biosynthesis